MAEKKPVKMSDADLKFFEDMLLEKRRELVTAQSDSEKANVFLDQKNQSGDGGDSEGADSATDINSLETNLSLAAREGKYLVYLEEALKRIKNGTFGVCKICGQLIPKVPAANKLVIPAGACAACTEFNRSERSRSKRESPFERKRPASRAVFAFLSSPPPSGLLLLSRNRAEERVRKRGAECVNSVGVWFAMRIGEVAEENDGASLVRVGDDACTRKSRLAECLRRDLCAHKLARVQLPAEGSFCSDAIGEGVVAYDVQDSGRGDLLVLELAVHQNHLHELQKVGDATEHAGTPDGEKLLQNPGAFVVDFALDFSMAKFAKLGCGNF